MNEENQVKGMTIRDLATKLKVSYADTLNAAHDVGIETPRGKGRARILNEAEQAAITGRVEKLASRKK
jgi:transposase